MRKILKTIKKEFTLDYGGIRRDIETDDKIIDLYGVSLYVGDDYSDGKIDTLEVVIEDLDLLETVYEDIPKLYKHFRNEPVDFFKNRSEILLVGSSYYSCVRDTGIAFGYTFYWVGEKTHNLGNTFVKTSINAENIEGMIDIRNISILLFFPTDFRYFVKFAFKCFNLFENISNIFGRRDDIYIDKDRIKGLSILSRIPSTKEMFLEMKNTQNFIKKYDARIQLLDLL